jgi:hypothetical protein
MHSASFHPDKFSTSISTYHHQKFKKIRKMRLINVHTRKLEYFVGDEIPKYAILSHTWGAEEVTFADYENGNFHHMKGYQKIKYICEQAVLDGLNYIWVDTCSIDKSSSAELSEAINSMFHWYERSKRCYVYLEDVDKSSEHLNDQFSSSRWWSRGWTLQELIAPHVLQFYDKTWEPLGSKSRLVKTIVNISGVPRTALLYPNLVTEFSVAERMSWASRRETTRVEDTAYCLLGIFEINIPLLYGEGIRAFTRLQEEIIRLHDDETIFAWNFSPMCLAHPSDMEPLPFSEYPWPLLATSPKNFKNSRHLKPIQEGRSRPPYALNNQGLQIQLPTLEVNDADGYTHKIGLLGCLRSGHVLRFIGIYLEARGTKYFRQCARLNALTFLVSEAWAISAKEEDLTISRQYSSDWDRPDSNGANNEILQKPERSIVYNTDSLHKSGYYLIKVFTMPAPGCFRWNPKSRTIQTAGIHENQTYPIVLLFKALDNRYFSLMVRPNDVPPAVGFVTYPEILPEQSFDQWSKDVNLKRLSTYDRDHHVTDQQHMFLGHRKFQCSFNVVNLLSREILSVTVNQVYTT